VSTGIPRSTADDALEVETRRADGWLAEFVSRPFELVSGNVLRVVVRGCRDGRELLVFVFHPSPSTNGRPGCSSPN